MVSDISVLEKGTFSLDCNGTSIDVKFKIAELPNDMKMLCFLAGELSNASTYFSTFADVSTDTMRKLDGTFGFTGKKMWKPWKYETRINVAKQIDTFKRSLAKKRLAESTRRSKITNFIAEKHNQFYVN